MHFFPHKMAGDKRKRKKRNEALKCFKIDILKEVFMPWVNNLLRQSAVVKLPQKDTKELYYLCKNFQKHDS